MLLRHRHVLNLKDDRVRTSGKPGILKPWFIYTLALQEEELKILHGAERGRGSSRQMVLNHQRGFVKAQRVCHTIPVSGREKLNL